MQGISQHQMLEHIGKISGMKRVAIRKQVLVLLAMAMAMAMASDVAELQHTNE
jgi:hypothetical protein